ncbi:hypothetical protein NHP21005_02400 [Helicobacter sp. NHP21005]|nr:hypothetical protein NHP21005_02400 [Helicobacter sp. NHP21005]
MKKWKAWVLGGFVVGGFGGAEQRSIQASRFLDRWALCGRKLPNRYRYDPNQQFHSNEYPPLRAR